MNSKETVSRFIECLIPISHCNLRCSYCYIIQQNRRDQKMPAFAYPPEYIGKAFSKKRWSKHYCGLGGGAMMVNLCGAGETLMCPEITEIIAAILKEGHFMNVTTNGTISAKFDEILRLPEDFLSRLSFSFSLHYLELERTNNLQKFADNVSKVRKAGCSVLVQMNLCDGYIARREEIKAFCMNNFGAFPQLALTRKQGGGFKIFSDYTDEEYINYGKEFDSPLFDFTCQNFRVKRHEFCYAGNWSYTLNLATGGLSSCYFRPPFYNIYKNVDEAVPALTVGNNCGEAYCINSSHFMSLGVIPEIPCPSYAELRDRPAAKWYSQRMKDFLSTKLFETNPQYSPLKKRYANIRFRFYTLVSRIRGKLRIRTRIKNVINRFRS